MSHWIWPPIPASGSGLTRPLRTAPRAGKKNSFLRDSGVPRTGWAASAALRRPWCSRHFENAGLIREEAQEGSLVDLLVEFIRLKHFLEEVLHAPVDLATPEALKKQLRERLLKEAVRAA